MLILYNTPMTWLRPTLQQSLQSLEESGQGTVLLPFKLQALAMVDCTVEEGDAVLGGLLQRLPALR